jgi:anti-sigma B factor antagonist
MARSPAFERRTTGYNYPRVSGMTEQDGGANGISDAEFLVEVDDVSDRVTVIAVHGQADLHTAPELRSAIGDAIDRGAVSLVVDFSEATFIDSMTLGVLLGAVKRLRPSGGSLSVVCTDPHIRRIFEITLLDRVFALHTERGSAVDGAGGG